MKYNEEHLKTNSKISHSQNSVAVLNVLLQLFYLYVTINGKTLCCHNVVIHLTGSHMHFKANMLNKNLWHSTQTVHEITTV